jgi:alpha/beta hydrolase family protein
MLLVAALDTVVVEPPHPAPGATLRFRSHDDYVQQFARQLARLVEAGVLLPADAEAMRMNRRVPAPMADAMAHQKWYKSASRGGMSALGSTLGPCHNVLRCRVLRQRRLFDVVPFQIGPKHA